MGACGGGVGMGKLPETLPVCVLNNRLCPPHSVAIALYVGVSAPALTVVLSR